MKLSASDFVTSLSSAVRTESNNVLSCLFAGVHSDLFLLNQYYSLAKIEFWVPLKDNKETKSLYVRLKECRSCNINGNKT